MLFDQLLGFVERGYLPPAVADIVVNSRLFVFPGRAHEVLKEEDSLGPQDIEDLNDHFRLPFDTIAIEDSASMILLADNEGDQSGLSGKRFFLEVEEMGNLRAGEFLHGPRELPAEQLALFRNVYMVSWGYVNSMVYDPTRFGGNHLNAGFQYAGHLCIEKKKGNRPELTALFPPQILMRHCGNNVLTAFAEVNAFNQPNRWILEETPAKPRHKGKAKKGPRHPRSDSRPVYTLLKPDEIREKLGLTVDEESASSPRPHERRGHWRTYHHERFAASGLLGKRRWMKATWVGPSEAVVGKRRYRVCLEL